jgi:uncharacterized membrane protein
MYKVIAYLDRKEPQPPVWVRATSRDDARDQVNELIDFNAERQYPSDVRLYIFDESAITAPAVNPIVDDPCFGLGKKAVKT